MTLREFIVRVRTQSEARRRLRWPVFQQKVTAAFRCMERHQRIRLCVYVHQRGVCLRWLRMSVQEVISMYQQKQTIDTTERDAETLQ